MDALTKECRTMRRSARALLLGAAAVVSALGCRSNCDPVERELHARENDLLAAREEIDRCHAINEGLQMELQALHGDPVRLPSRRPRQARRRRLTRFVR